MAKIIRTVKKIPKEALELFNAKIGMDCYKDYNEKQLARLLYDCIRQVEFMDSVNKSDNNSKNETALEREKILNEAIKCVCGDRERDYGTPENNFNTIAKMWGNYLGIDNITGKDVAIMMCLLKIARIKAGNSRDSFIDLAGYAACAGEINEKYKE